MRLRRSASGNRITGPVVPAGVAHVLLLLLLLLLVTLVKERRGCCGSRPVSRMGGFDVEL
jgi:hypothetical protein